MSDYLKNSGAKRIDVLRARGPFGSPLSLSAVAVYLAFYSLYIHKSLLGFIGSIIIILLSGSRTALVICFILFLSTISLRKIAVKKIVCGFLVMAILFSIFFYYADKLGLTKLMDRVLTLESYKISNDSSFLGRSNTTVNTSILILEQMPQTFFFPLNSKFVSDSAIVSMIAGSGMFLVVNFLAFLFLKISYLKINRSRKLIFAFCVVLLALMVGDAFVPAVSFYLFLVLYHYPKKV
jgi:hypothetical protein